jgi:hypothetical protein
MNKANIISLVTLSALSSLFATAVLAVEDAGRVMFVAGKATIVTAAGKERIARKGDILKQGDTLVTSDKGMIQVKMRDDGVMAIRPNTELKLNDMVPQLNKTDGPSQALLLSRGGVRVLTGNERNKLGYVIKTAATSLRLRDGDTEALVIPKLTPAAGRVADVTPGTYNRVNAGIGIIQGASDKGISLAANQVSYTPSVSVAPVLVASLPPSYINTTIPLPPVSVTGSTVLAPATVTTIASGSVLSSPSIATSTQTAPTTTTLIGTATPTPVSLAPLPVALAPIAVISPPPPVMIAPPTLISSPILVMQPVILPPPPPPVITTVTLIQTTPTLTTTTGTFTGTYCIRGISC